MRIDRLHLASLLSLLLVGVLAACQQAGETDVTRTEDGVMRLGSVEVVDTVARAVAPSDRPLVLEGMRGSAHLVGRTQSVADLSFIRRGRGKTRADGQKVLDGISITERGTESAYTYTLSADRKPYAVVDVQGQVPRPTALRIDRLSGSVHVEGVEGTLTIEHEHGNVIVEGAAAPVDVDIENGNVQVGFRSVPAQGQIQLQTTNGDVDARLPPGASVQVDAQTNVGVIRTQGLSFTAERLEPLNAGARYNAQLGGDGPTLKMRTETGSITIQARDTARADTVEQAPTAIVPAPDTTIPAGPDTLDADTASSDTSMAPDTSVTAEDTVSVNR